MRPFQTIARIIIATSVVNCAPVPPVTDPRSDVVQHPAAAAHTYPPAPGSSSAPNPAPAPAKDPREEFYSVLARVGFYGAGLAMFAYGFFRGKNSTDSTSSPRSDYTTSNSTFSRSISSSGNGAISRRLAKLADEEPRFLSLISDFTRAIESLD